MEFVVNFRDFCCTSFQSGVFGEGREAPLVFRTRRFLMTQASLVNDTAVTDRRGTPRHRAILGAKIVFQDGFCSMGCVILNFSDRGALLRLSDLCSCPRSFVLRPRFDPPRKCELAWQQGQIVGVQYV